MANGQHVVSTSLLFGASLALFVLSSTCSVAEDSRQPTEVRGRVMNQDTLEGIQNAIVIGRYLSNRGARGGSSCNRIESAITDNSGWFVLPLDPSAGLLISDAYHVQFQHGQGLRFAQNGVNGDASSWQVLKYEWDRENKVGRIVGVEPEIYTSHAEAMEASRETKDVYLRRLDAGKRERLYELSRLTGLGICGGRHMTTAGALPFLEAILAEQRLLGASNVEIDQTLRNISMAR